MGFYFLGGIMSRKVARDWLFKLVFELTFQNNSVNFYEEFLALEDVTEENKNFVTTIYSGIAENYASLLEELNGYLNGYKVESLFKVDLAILLIALFEHKYYTMTDKKIIANECVELAKKYSTDKSHKFINGVVGSILKD